MTFGRGRVLPWEAPLSRVLSHLSLGLRASKSRQAALWLGVVPVMRVWRKASASAMESALVSLQEADLGRAFSRKTMALVVREWSKRLSAGLKTTMPGGRNAFSKRSLISSPKFALRNSAGVITAARPPGARSSQILRRKRA